MQDGQLLFKGKVGAEISLEEARSAARLTMKNLLAQAKKACQGDLGLLKRCVQMTVYVQSAPDFYQQPDVANGATELLNEIWGEEFLPVRTALGVTALPMNICVEIDAIFELDS